MVQLKEALVNDRDAKTPLARAAAPCQRLPHQPLCPVPTSRRPYLTSFLPLLPLVSTSSPPPPPP